jgi:hypothetical protein
MAGAKAMLLLSGLLFGPVLVAGDVACGGEDKRISDAFVNDGYCDCEVEGTDEPATGACGTASFRCENRPHAPLHIPASRVNDGVCDCCDGSDEFQGHTQCPQVRCISCARLRVSHGYFEHVARVLAQTCDEAAARAREAGKRELQLLESGMKVREQQGTEVGIACRQGVPCWQVREQRVIDGMTAKAARAVELSSVRGKLVELEKQIEVTLEYPGVP